MTPQERESAMLLAESILKPDTSFVLTTRREFILARALLDECDKTCNLEHKVARQLEVLSEVTVELVKNHDAVEALNMLSAYVVRG